jgi:hypothetical protein
MNIQQLQQEDEVAKRKRLEMLLDRNKNKKKFEDDSSRYGGKYTFWKFYCLL